MSKQGPKPAVRGTIAVFTGDLVGSRGNSDETIDSSIGALERAAEALGKHFDFDSRFTRYRGDGWQMVVTKPQKLLFACICMFAALAAADTGLRTRLSIGVGPVNWLGGTNLADASGPAFISSGENLETMSKSHRLAIGGLGIGTWQRAVVELTDWTIQTWTPQQAEALYIYLLGGFHNNTQRAENIGISRQAFEARLNGTGFQPLLTAIDAFDRFDFEEAAS